MRKEAIWVGLLAALLAALLLYQPLRPRQTHSPTSKGLVIGTVPPALRGPWVAVAKAEAPPDQVVVMEKVGRQPGEERIILTARGSFREFPLHRRYVLVMRSAEATVDLAHAVRLADGTHQVGLLLSYDFLLDYP